MADQISVTVGTSVKVTDPNDKFQNSTFSRSLTRTVTVAPIPEDNDKYESYEGAIADTFANLEKELRDTVEAQVQAEIRQFYLDNGVELNEEE